MTNEVERLAIVNEAALLLGDEPLTTLDIPSNDDQPSLATIGVGLYSMVVSGLLSSKPWRFCRDVVTLNRIDTVTEGITIPPGWYGLYERPSQATHIRALYIEDRRMIRFDIFGQKIATDVINADTVVYAEIGINVDETLWPPLFRQAVVHALASAFASAMIENARLSQLHLEMSQMKIQELSNMEFQGRTPGRVDLSWLKAHRAGHRGSRSSFRSVG